MIMMMAMVMIIMMVMIMKMQKIEMYNIYVPGGPNPLQKPPVFIECGSANSFELSPRFANLSIRGSRVRTQFHLCISLRYHYIIVQQMIYQKYLCWVQETTYCSEISFYSQILYLV